MAQKWRGGALFGRRKGTSKGRAEGVAKGTNKNMMAFMYEKCHDEIHNFAC